MFTEGPTSCESQRGRHDYCAILETACPAGPVTSRDSLAIDPPGAGFFHAIPGAPGAFPGIGFTKGCNFLIVLSHTHTYIHTVHTYIHACMHA